MFGRGIPFVSRKPVHRILCVHLHHDAIPRHLRHDAGCRNAEALPVTLNDGCLADRKRIHRKAVDEDMLRCQSQSLDSSPHRLMRGAKDVEAVDLVDVDDGSSPGDVAIAR